MPTSPIRDACLKCGQNVSKLFATTTPEKVFNCPRCHIGLTVRKAPFRYWDEKAKRFFYKEAFTLDFP